MTSTTLIIRIRGQDTAVPALAAEGYSIVRTGRLLRSAQLFDEELVEAEHFPKPSEAIDQIRRSDFGADVFAYARPFDPSQPPLDYLQVPDNLAVVSTSSYEKWWTELPQEARKNMRIATKRGVAVRAADFDDTLVAGIKSIYDESSVRQGRRFWHYQKPLERVRMLNATYLERSQFIGAYLKDELIGFIKYVRVDRVAILIQIIAMEAHRDKKTVNALLRQAIELCHQQGLEILTYGKFDYGINQNSTLTEFKRRNGFRRMDFPRLYLPLTARGRMALSLGLHAGWRGLVPLPMLGYMQTLRGRAMNFLSHPTSRGAG